jgi:hypothetical protein
MPVATLKIHQEGVANQMKRNPVLIFLSTLLFFSPALATQGQPIGFSDVRPELEGILEDLSTKLDIFDDLQRKMDASAKTNENYNQQKNIFLSSMLAITTISAICEYERDLLTLFIDLREKNRAKFYDVRIESLQTSVRQIENMYRQIQINYTIFPPHFFEAPLVRTERLTIQAAVTLLNRSRQLLLSVHQQ